MKNYEKPAMREWNILVESIYAASGNVPVDPPTPPIEYGSWDIHCEYRNHNSGSHSEVAIIAVYSGNVSGESLTMNFQVTGFRLGIVKDSAYTVSNVSESGFTITRNNHFNPGERVEFNIQITSLDSKYHGSVGKTGEYIPCTINCSGYSFS